MPCTVQLHCRGPYFSPGALYFCTAVRLGTVAERTFSPGALYFRTAVRLGTVAERTGSCTLVQPCLVYLVIHPGSDSGGYLARPGV